MRVLFFCPTLGDGGADRVVVTLLKHLDRTRFVPTLVLMRREGVMLADVPPDVEVVSLDVPRLAVAAPTLARLLRARTPDVVFSTHGGSNIVVSLAHALAASRARLVLSERSALVRADRSRTRTTLEIPAKRWTYRRADLVTAVSEGVAMQLEHTLGLARAKISVVYNPIVDDELHRLAAEPVEHPWFNEEIPLVLAVGRLVAIKDYPTLLAAFARLRANQHVRLVVLGEGPLRSELEENARALRIADDIAFIGFDKNPFRYMARATVLMHASKAEGLPAALIQAMACGLPVVSTDCDHGPREVICHGDDGFLVPVANVRALAENVNRLLADRNLRANVSGRARVASRRFSTAAAVSRYEAAIVGDAA